MESLLALALPPGVTPWAAAVLIVISFFTSALTGALGLGGGIMMLAVMAQLLAPTVLIPVHAVVQVGSNLGRVIIMREHVHWPFVTPFLIGSAIGVTIGALVVFAVPTALLLMIIGVFVLWSAWAKKLRPSRIPPIGFLPVGVATSFATMFVGGTGPFVAAFLVPDPLNRHQIIATHAAFMTFQHALKIGAFWSLGFTFLAWLPMLGLMIVLGFVGTMVGNRMLNRLPEENFARAFKLVLSALALKLIYDGIRAWL